jgi:hypothetical protein
MPSTFRASAEIVLVPVMVTDRKGKPINGLRAENFTVFDEQIPQPIVSLAGEDSPCSVVLVLDVSDSMARHSVPSRMSRSLSLPSQTPTTNSYY